MSYTIPYCNYVLNGEVACAVPLLDATVDECRFESLDDDDRIFAVGPDYKIYAAPRFPCSYRLLLQWQGINRKWNNNDLVAVDEQLREAVISRVEYKVAMKEKDRAAARDWFDAYTVELRTLRYRYRDEQDTEMKRDCTSAIEQLMSTSLYPMYSDSQYLLGGGSSGETVCCALSGALEPEGIVSANPGSTYYDTVNFGFWVKSSGTGNTGWTPLIT